MHAVALMVIEVETRSSGMPSKRSCMSSSEAIETPPVHLRVDAARERELARLTESLLVPVGRDVVRTEDGIERRAPRGLGVRHDLRLITAGCCRASSAGSRRASSA